MSEEEVERELKAVEYDLEIAQEELKKFYQRFKDEQMSELSERQFKMWKKHLMYLNDRQRS